MSLGSLTLVSVLTIRTLPDPVLRSKTSQIAKARFGSAGLQRLIDSMHQTMDAVSGVGLAGPQVGIGQAIFVFHLDERRGHVINPVIETWGDAVQDTTEGCLSVPELYFTPSRAQYAKVTGVDVNGKDVEYEGEGLFARMLQHEVDHLDGYLFVDRLADEQFRQARRAMASAEFAATTRRINAERAVDTSSTFGAGSAFMPDTGRG